MRVLHYFLGFPPYRSGGLTRFATDLMDTQIKNGDKVFALWPGRIKLINSAISIRKRQLNNGVVSCELVNPLPIPFDEGIKNPQWFMKECKNLIAFKEFVRDNKIEIMHVHTFMGLYSEFLDVLNDLNVKVVFTAHDYFPICFRTYMFHYGHDYAENHSVGVCANDCANGLSYRKMLLLQSSLYRRIKDNCFIKALRKKHRDRATTFENGKRPGTNVAGRELMLYRKLRMYYSRMFDKCDVIHFGSQLAKEVYAKYFEVNENVVLPMSNSRIVRRAIKEKIVSKKLRVAYLADRKQMKGFSALIKALDELERKNPGSFELNLFGIPVAKEYVHNFGQSFEDAELSDFFNKTDVLVAPSKWHETFGFTIAEALGYGVPVITAKNVGASEVVGECGIIMDDSDVKSIKRALVAMNDHKKLAEMRRHIMENDKLIYWPDFVERMYDIYRSVL